MRPTNQTEQALAVFSSRRRFDRFYGIQSQTTKKVRLNKKSERDLLQSDKILNLE